MLSRTRKILELAAKVNNNRHKDDVNNDTKCVNVSEAVVVNEPVIIGLDLFNLDIEAVPLNFDFDNIGESQLHNCDRHDLTSQNDIGNAVNDCDASHCLSSLANDCNIDSNATKNVKDCDNASHCFTSLSTDCEYNIDNQEKVTHQISGIDSFQEIIYETDAFSKQNDDDPDYIPENDNVPENNGIPENNYSSDSECVSEKENEYGNMNHGRKRSKNSNPENWKKKKAQKMRMYGQAYLDYTRSREGKIKQDKMRSARKLGPRCTSKKCEISKVRFCNEFSEEIRKNIFSAFWNNMTWDQRKVFVSSHVSRFNTKRCTKNFDENSRRLGTFVYTLHNGTNALTVCREMFLNTLDLKPFTVQSWVNSSVLAMQTGKENLNQSRRENNYSIRKCVTADIPITEFFDQLAKLPSHYVRRDSSKLFLDEEIKSLSRLYEIYKNYCTEKGLSISCRKVFERKFHKLNLSLFRPKKDFCDLCCEHKVGNIEESVWKKHILNKDQARSDKDRDKEKAKNNELILLTMDLQAVKVAPYLTASSLYFKTKLCCHNFTVFDCGTSDATCYWFTELDSSLCASTFVSCLLDYLERHCLQRKLPIVIFSDGCTYQNRNCIMSNALLNFSMLHNITITQKFLERGHTQMECDSVHSCVERKLKNRIIQLPSDYLKATLESRRKPKPYEAFMVDHTFFKDFSKREFLRYSSIRPGKKVDDPTVTDLKQIKYTSNGTIEIKISFDETGWSPLPMRSKSFLPIRHYPNLHSKMLPISDKKYKHLQSLKNILTADCHAFYDNIPHE